MTTSATGRNSRWGGARGGYTLLEICIVMFILALLIGLAAPNVSSWLAEEQLRAPLRQLELFARTARITAIDRQRPFDLLITAGGFQIEEAPGWGKPEPTVDPYPLPTGIEVRSEGWGETVYSTPDERRWRFLPNGLCQPLSVKLTHGLSEIAIRFDPLTADVDEETYAFQ
jgi:type II secretory pathway pseudopilin PulG